MIKDKIGHLNQASASLVLHKDKTQPQGVVTLIWTPVYLAKKKKKKKASRAHQIWVLLP